MVEQMRNDSLPEQFLNMPEVIDVPTNEMDFLQLLRRQQKGKSHRLIINIKSNDILTHVKQVLYYPAPYKALSACHKKTILAH